MSTNPDQTTETIVLGAGCFWCTESVFQQIPGVSSVVSGYTGGQLANPSYEQVCSGKTGHNEVARLTFDPSAVSLEKILETFWKMHDPTTPNRQGNDIGTQYRSGVYYASEAQKAGAEASRARRRRSSRPRSSPRSRRWAISTRRRITTRTTTG